MTLDEIARHIAANIGTWVQQTNLFYGQMPKGIVPCVSLHELQGPAAHTAIGLGGAIRTERPQLSVHLKHADFETGDAQIKAIRDLLVKVVNESLTYGAGNTYYVGIDPIGNPFMLARDENDAWEFVANFQIEKEPSAA